MIKKRNLLENSLLYFAIGVLIFNLYLVTQNMKNIKELNENSVYLQNQDNIYENQYENQYENFDDTSTVKYFIPSDTFQGAMDNYIFTTRDEGTGYYYDN
jgi:hypothetical protein